MIKRSEDWWMAQAQREGDAAVGAGVVEARPPKDENWWVDPARREAVVEVAPCPETVNLAAKRAARWAMANTKLSAQELIDLDLAIRDLAGPV